MENNYTYSGHKYLIDRKRIKSTIIKGKLVIYF